MPDSVRSSVPLHYRIAQVLRSRLESGTWPSDGTVATEQRLCEEFSASRTTVRQALSQLKLAGLLESRTGVGTRGVAALGKRRVVRSGGDPLHAGLGTKARVVSLGVVPASAPIAGFFKMSPGAAVWHSVRVHMLDDTPLSVVDSYLPAELGASIKRADLRRSTYELLWEKFRIRLHRSVHTLRVGRAELDVAAMLGISLADPLLRIQSCVYLQDETPIRWIENYFREDKYEYVAEMEWPPLESAARRTVVRADKSS